MILKAREIKKLNDTIQILFPLQLKMPFAYDIACIAREVSENDTAISTMKQEIIEKYAKRDEDGRIIVNSEDGAISVNEEKVYELNKELDALLNKEIELKSDKIKLSDIADLDLTVGQIEALIPLIEK